MIRTTLRAYALVITSRSRDPPDLPGRSSYTLEAGQPTPAWSFTSASPHRVFIVLNRYGNINPFSIAYAVRPRLRTRLTLSGLTLLRKPWVFGVRVSRPHSRYSFRHNHFCFVQHTLSVHLHPRAERSPTRCACAQIRSFGGRLESRTLSAQDPLTSELLRTL